jgi:hypothetical protein
MNIPSKMNHDFMPSLPNIPSDLMSPPRMLLAAIETGGSDNVPGFAPDYRPSASWL